MAGESPEILDTFAAILQAAYDYRREHYRDWTTEQEYRWMFDTIHHFNDRLLRYDPVVDFIAAEPLDAVHDELIERW